MDFISTIGDVSQEVDHTSNITQEIFHVALQIKNDLENTPGHPNAYNGIDEEHVNSIIPESLFCSYLYCLEEQKCLKRLMKEKTIPRYVVLHWI